MPPVLGLLHGQHHKIKLFDRAHAVWFHACVDGVSGDPDAESQRARLHRANVQPGGLGDDGGVGLETIDDGGERADSAAFFANHAFQEHIGRRTESQGLQNPHRIKAGRESGLHIAGAATVELAFLDLAAPGRARPQRFVARGHDVHVAVEDERAGRMFFLVLLAASRPARDYVETVVEGDAVVAERGM